MLRKSLLLIAISVLVTSLLPSSPAAAYPGMLINYGRVNGTGIHLQPHSSSPYHAMIAPGRAVTDLCYMPGQTLNGTAYWDLVYHAGYHRAGFTNEWYMTRQDQTLRCSDHAAMAETYGTNFTLADPGTVAMHSCPDNACQALVFLPAGMAAHGNPIEICTTTGAYLNQQTNIWSLMYYEGHAGWTHRHWLAHDNNDNLGPC